MRRSRYCRWDLEGRKTMSAFTCSFQSHRQSQSQSWTITCSFSSRMKRLMASVGSCFGRRKQSAAPAMSQSIVVLSKGRAHDLTQTVLRESPAAEERVRHRFLDSGSSGERQRHGYLGVAISGPPGLSQSCSGRVLNSRRGSKHSRYQVSLY
jgi:hypothetical protein